jgi:hypothetical protein
LADDALDVWELVQGGSNLTRKVSNTFIAVQIDHDIDLFFDLRMVAGVVQEDSEEMVEVDVAVADSTADRPTLNATM